MEPIRALPRVIKIPTEMVWLSPPLSPSLVRVVGSMTSPGRATKILDEAMSAWIVFFSSCASETEAEDDEEEVAAAPLCLRCSAAALALV